MNIALFLAILSNLLFFALHIINSGSFPRPLSPAEEKKYLEAMKNGGKDARDKLIEHNLRLVAHIVKKYYSSGTEADDLISIGTIGLIKAISTFDSSKNVRLATYASRCIENEVLMHFRSLKKTAQDVSMDEPIDMDKDGNTLALMDVICLDDTILEDIDFKIKSAHLRKYILEVLEPRERMIIEMRYGLGCKQLTQREVAQKLDISRSYVSRIEKKALQRLKKRFDMEDNPLRRNLQRGEI